MKNHDYATMFPDDIQAEVSRAPVAYFPLGTLEYHGPHLPVGNDAIKAQAILERVCERTGGVILPALFWGIGGGHKEYPTSIILREEILVPLLEDILEGLVRIGFRVIVLLTGHYPAEQTSAVKQVANRLHQAHPDIHVWALPEYEAYPGEFRGDHAAKWETSILQALRPELVDLNRLKGAMEPDAPLQTRTIEEMNAPGPLHGILGENPARSASPALGKETVDIIVENLVTWVQEALDNGSGEPF
jgi:creatinine amidohydrolase